MSCIVSGIVTRVPRFGWVLSLLLSSGVLLVAGEPAEVAAPSPRAVNAELNGLQAGLGSLPLLGRGRTRSISAENPTGAQYFLGLDAFVLSPTVSANSPQGVSQ